MDSDLPQNDLLNRDLARIFENSESLITLLESSCYLIATTISPAALYRMVYACQLQIYMPWLLPAWVERGVHDCCGTVHRCIF